MSERGNTSPNVDGNTAKVLADQLTFASVYADADFDSERAHGFANRPTGSDRAGRAIKRRQHAIPRSVDFTSAESCEFRAKSPRNTPRERRAIDDHRF